MDLERRDICSLDKKQLQENLAELGWPAYRYKQVEEWLWNKGVRKFAEMTNLSKEQRLTLESKFYIPELQLDKLQRSIDGTIKFRFRLYDGYFIESVLIPVPEESRFTVCVSSQAGCSLNCSFCATGKMGLLRQLTASEIFDQYIQVNRQCQTSYEKNLSNIVFMGMGEPLLNYKQVMSSISRLTDQEGPGLSAKRITLSTAGIAKMIRKLADDAVKVNLALSLHAASDAKRKQMMPINESNDLQSLMEAIKYFYKKTGNRISYEYIAFEGFNDNLEDAKNLIRLCSQFPVRVNIIEYNSVPGIDFHKSTEDRINRFAQEVRKHGIMITVRRSRGKDIDAACGQLANQESDN